jgi:hypothetical protein
MAAAVGILPALPAIAAHDGDQEDKYWEAQSHIDQLYDEIEPPIMMGDTVEIYDLFSDEMRELKITTPSLVNRAGRRCEWQNVSTSDAPRKRVMRSRPHSS